MEVFEKIEKEKNSKGFGFGGLGSKIDNTLRNQILLWRLLIGSLFAGTFIDVALSLNANDDFTENYVYGTVFKVGVGVFMLILYILTYKISHWDDNHNLTIDLTALQHRNAVNYTTKVIKYLTEELIPTIDDEDKKLEIIKSVPSILNLISADEISKNMGMFQSSLVESLSIFEEQMRGVGDRVIQVVRGSLKNLPKVKKKKMSTEQINKLLEEELEEDEDNEDS